MPKLAMQPKTAQITLQELFDQFIAFKQIKNLSHESIDYYQNCFTFFTEYYPASQPCTDITKEVCLGYIQHLQQTRPHLKDTTIEAHIDERKTKFQAALKEHNIPQMQEALLAVGVSASDIWDLHQAFTLVAPGIVFMQGMVDQIMMSLLCRDENGRRLFQRLIDGEIE